mmetsp:Transcript_9279/g.18685  ORF Transcript_9279/g.18685 Transcript_9279/m.18685 type:complete len:521 (+) Transcript_9279:19-1581(+)
MAITTTTTTAARTKDASLAHDLQFMVALSGFSFLIHEMRNFAQGRQRRQRQRDNGDDTNGDDESLWNNEMAAFARIMSFPLTVKDLLELVQKNKKSLVPVEGEARYQAHLEMCSFLLNSSSNNKYSTSNNTQQGDDEADATEAGQLLETQHQGPIFLNYTDYDAGAAHDAVYSMVLDHVHRRIIVVWRGSITKKDWTADITVTPVNVPHPLYNNPNNNNKHKWPHYMKMHKGFYDYIFQPVTVRADTEQDDDDGEEEKGQQQNIGPRRLGHNKKGKTENKKQQPRTVFDEVVQQIQALLEQYPDYKLVTTGLSLGGALTAVFAFFAAADDRLPPITCYSLASPKIGKIAFRKACLYYERIGKLRLLRVANQFDPVVLLPRNTLYWCSCFFLCPNVTYLLMCCMCCTQASIYRHVGLGLILPLNENKQPIFVHTRFHTNFCRTLLSDWAKLCARGYFLLCHFCCLVLSCGKNAKYYRQFHGYAAYWKRVRDHLTDFEGLTLEGLYDEIVSDDHTHVRTMFM